MLSQNFSKQREQAKQSFFCKLVLIWRFEEPYFSGNFQILPMRVEFVLNPTHASICSFYFPFYVFVFTSSSSSSSSFGVKICLFSLKFLSVYLSKSKNHKRKTHHQSPPKKSKLKKVQTQHVKMFVRFSLKKYMHKDEA